MIYKWYVKGKSDFSKHNTLGEPIRQDVKNRDVNSGEKTMTINTRKIAKKKETTTINNSILYNILVNRASANGNPLCIELQRISKLVPGDSHHHQVPKTRHDPAR